MISASELLHHMTPKVPSYELGSIVYLANVTTVDPVVAFQHKVDTLSQHTWACPERELLHNLLEVSTDLVRCPSGPVAGALTLPD